MLLYDIKTSFIMMKMPLKILTFKKKISKLTGTSFPNFRKVCVFACVTTYTISLHKDYPVSAGPRWRWNISFNVQMFHPLSRGSIICWILCFSPHHPVILQSPYCGAFLLRLTFELLLSYCRTGFSPIRGPEQLSAFEVRSFGGRSAGFVRKGAFEMLRHGGRLTSTTRVLPSRV